MKFQITLNMPSRAGAAVHGIMCDHKAKSLEEFLECLDGVQFITVREIFKDGENFSYYDAGDIAINVDWIGKVKVFNL